jgi:hypothetical protein
MKLAEEQNRTFREQFQSVSREAAPKGRRPVLSVDLSGRWYAVWQSTVDGRECVNSEVVDITQRGTRIMMRNLNRSLENPRGGYLWRGELKLYDNSRLMGHYVSAEPNVTAKGVFYFLLNHIGQFMSGKWVGCNHDFDLTWGFGVLARDIERAREKFKRLKHLRRGVTY